MSFVPEALVPLVWLLGATAVAGLLVREIAGVAARVAVRLRGDREALAEPSHGAEGMLSRRGVARCAFAPDEEGAGRGMVLVRGELWRARSGMPVAAGEAVEVVGVDGLTLEVRPAGAAGPYETQDRKGSPDEGRARRQRAGARVCAGSGH